jgi:hypothetical protein
MPATMPTFEAFVTPIGFTSSRMDMQTFMARLTRITGIDGNHLNPSTQPFIFKKLTQLIESPTKRRSTTSLRLLQIRL